jgi:hypothetical protein
MIYNNIIVSGLLSNGGFFLFLMAYLVKKEGGGMYLMRVFLMIGQVFLVTWGIVSFEIINSYPLICWNGLFFLINFRRYYLEKDKTKTIHESLQAFVQNDIFTL